MNKAIRTLVYFVQFGSWLMQLNSNDEQRYKLKNRYRVFWFEKAVPAFVVRFTGRPKSSFY